MAATGNPSSVLAVTLPGVVPGAVTGLVLSNITASSITATWNAETAGSGVRVYLVEYQVANAGNWTTFNGVPFIDTANPYGNVGPYSAVLANLQAGTTYNVRVTAINNLGVGTVGTAVSATTVGAGTGTTTWNSKDLNAITLDTTTQLTATSTRGSQGLVRSTSSHSTGKIIASCVITAATADFAFGIATAGAYNAAPLGVDANSVGLFTCVPPQRAFFNAKSYTSSGSQAASPNGTVVNYAGPVLYDATGEAVSLVGTGYGAFQVAFNGVVNTAGGNIVGQLVFYNGLVYRQDSNGIWYSILNSSGTWSAGTTDPRTAVANVSPDNTVVNYVGPTIIDAIGETVALTGSGYGAFQVTFNGVTNVAGGNIIGQLLFKNDLVYRQDSNGSWNYTASAASPWTGPVDDPRTVNAKGTQTGDEIVLCVDFDNKLYWYTNQAMINTIGAGSWNGVACTPFVSGGLSFTGTGPWFLAYGDDEGGIATLRTASTVGTTLKITLPTGGNLWDTTTPAGVIAVPGAVTGIAATTGVDSISLTWTASTIGTASAYRVQFRPKNGPTWFNGALVTATNATVGGLLDSTAYELIVTAQSAAGNGPASAITSATTATASKSLLRLRGLNATTSDLSSTGLSAIHTAQTNANAVTIPIVCSTASQTSTDVQLDVPLTTVSTWISSAVANGFHVILAVTLSCRDGTSAKTITPGPSIAGVATFMTNLQAVCVQAAGAGKTGAADGLWCGVELQPWAGAAAKDTGPFSTAHMAQWQSIYLACKTAWPAGLISYAASQRASGYETPNSDWCMKWSFWDAVVFDVFPAVPVTATTAAQIENYLDSAIDPDPSTNATTGINPLFIALDAYARKIGRKIIINACGIVPVTGNQVSPAIPVKLPPPVDSAMGSAWWQSVIDEVTKHVIVFDGFFAFSASVNGATGTNYGADYYGIRGYNASTIVDQAYAGLLGTGTTTLVAAPVNLAFGTVTPTSVTLSWGAVMGSSVTYVAEISKDQVNWTALGATGNLNVTFTGEAPATTYYFRVQAIVGSVTGPFSAITSVTTPATTTGATRDYTLQPGADGNFWNEPLHSGATWSAATDPMTVSLRKPGAINTTTNGQPVAIGAATDPIVTITSSGTAGTQRDVPLIAQVHIPVGTQSSGPYPGNNELTVFDKTQPYKIWSFSGLLTNGASITASTTSLTCGAAEVDDASGAMEDQTTGEFGLDRGPGIIRAWELNSTLNPSGLIQHTIAFGCDPSQLRAPNAWNDYTTIMPDGTASIMWPQTHTDFTTTAYTGKLPPGSTVGIPQSDVAPTGWPTGAMMLYNAAKNYGFAWRRTSTGGVTLFAEPSLEGNQLLSDMRTYLPQIVSRLCVLLNQTGASSRKGAGTRVTSPPPPLNVTSTATSITLNGVTNIVNGSGFFISGALNGYATVPSLAYTDDAGAVQTIPAANVTKTAYSYLHPSMNAGNHTIKVYDTAAPTVSASIMVTVPANTPYVPPTIANTATGGGPGPVALLQLFASMKGKHCISMQFIERGLDPTTGIAAIQNIQAKTGKWLGGISGDYWWDGSTSLTIDSSFNNYAKPYWAAGGIIMMDFGMPTPTPGGGNLDEAGLLTAGTATNTNLNAMLDSIAGGLIDFQNSNVTVIVRPYHELNGNWTWWGTAQLSDTGLKNLWIYTWNRWVVTHGLKNLIWMYCVNQDTTDLPIANRFPGNAYVDMLGCDVYTSNPASGTVDYNTLATYNLPMAMSEFGPGGPGGGDNSFAETTLVAALKTFPNYLFFDQWWSANTGIGWGMDTTKGAVTGDWSIVTAALSDSYIWNRGDFTIPTPSAGGGGTTTTQVGASADGSSLVAGSNEALFDANGNAYTINSTGGVNINGVFDNNSANVTEIARVGGLMWHENTGGLWYSKNLVTDSWGPAGGTTTSPFTVTTTTTTGGSVVGPLATATAGIWTIQTQGSTSFMVLLPSGYDATKKYAFMFYLHQLDQADTFYSSGGTTNDVLTEINPWFNSVAFRQAYPVIIVAPLVNMNGDTSGNTINFGGVSTAVQSVETDTFALFAQLQKTYSIDPTRVYITGNSMGGIGSWDWIIKYNTLTGTTGKIIKAALILAGAVYDWGYPTPNTSVVTNLTNVPIWAIHGGQDTTVPLVWDQNMYAAYGGSTAYNGSKAPNGNMRYLQDATLSHDVWDTYYVLPTAKTYFDWLFSQ